MRGKESHFILFVTTVLSHLTMLPMPFLFYQRGYVIEFCGSLFALLASFMYHSAESFEASLFLTAKEWHRLDNIGIICILGMWDIYLCCIQNPFIDMSCKCFCIFFTLIVQQKHPWDIRFTVTPIILFSIFPIVKYCFIEQRLPPLNVRHLLIGGLLASFAIPFFVLGLDEEEDPYRMYHGGWHFFLGLSSFFAWIMVKHPPVHGFAARQQNSMALRGDAVL